MHEAMKKFNCVGPSLNFMGAPWPPYSLAYDCVVTREWQTMAFAESGA